MLTREEFEAEIGPVRSALEQRRRKFLRFFYAGVVIAGLLVISAIFCPRAVLQAISTALQAHAPLTDIDVAAYRLFVLLAAVLAVISPLMTYRGERGFSVERIVYARLLERFGSFIPVPGGTITGADLRRIGYFAAPLLLLAGEGATGEMNGVRVRLCDAALLKREKGQDNVVFKGLLLLCEPLASTVWHVSEGLATALNDSVEHLAIRAGELTPQPWRGDEKLTYAASVLYRRGKDAVNSRMEKEELPAEKTYRLKYAIAPGLVRLHAPATEDSLCEAYELQYGKEALLAAIVSTEDLFALGSLFSPALDEQRTGWLYEVMWELDRLTQHLAAHTRRA